MPDLIEPTTALPTTALPTVAETTLTDIRDRTVQAWEQAISRYRFEAQRAWMLAPRPGDLVIELSMARLAGRTPVPLDETIGHLLRVVDEPVGADCQGRPEPVTYIQALDGRAIRWHNCQFLRVPDDSFPAPV